MDYLFFGVMAIFAILTCVALLHYFLLTRSVVGLKRELAAIKSISARAESGSTEIADPWIRMVVEVKNPIALAQRESPLAKMAAGTAPHVVIKKVYEQVMAQTKEQLKSRDVEADVSLIIL